MRMLETVWNSKKTDLQMEGLPFLKHYKYLGTIGDEVRISADKHTGLVVNQNNVRNFLRFVDVVGRDKKIVTDSPFSIMNESNDELDLENIYIEGGKDYNGYVSGGRFGRHFRNLNLKSHNDVSFSKRPIITDSVIECKNIYCSDTKRLPAFQGNTEVYLDGNITLDLTQDSGKTFWKDVSMNCDPMIRNAVDRVVNKKPSLMRYEGDLTTFGLDKVIGFDYKRIHGCGFIHIDIRLGCTLNLVVDYKNEFLVTF